MAIAPPTRLTIEEFLRVEAEAPDDVTVELINGQLFERPAMTTRGRLHAFVMSLLVFELVSWSRTFDREPVEVGSGEARCRLHPDRESFVGVDAGIWIGEQYAVPSNDPPLYDGPPVVAAGILSPSDKIEYIDEKISSYLTAGVRQVWILDPKWRTVTVYRPDTKPALFAEDDLLDASPDLPGFSIPASRFFGKSAPRPA